jgi:hypothetical protein
MNTEQRQITVNGLRIGIVRKDIKTCTSAYIRRTAACAWQHLSE